MVGFRPRVDDGRVRDGGKFSQCRKLFRPDDEKVEPVVEIACKIGCGFANIEADRRLNANAAHCFCTEIEGRSISPTRVVDDNANPLTLQSLRHGAVGPQLR